MFSIIWEKIKEILQRMLGSKTIENELHVAPLISSKMEAEIREWTDMYEGHPSWVKEPTYADPSRIVSLGLPSLIASEKARTALLEMKSDISAPTKEVEEANPDYVDPQKDVYGNLIPSATPKTIIKEIPIGDTSRAEYLNNQYQTKLLKRLRTNLEYGIAKGGLVIKPYIVVSDMIGENGQGNRVDIEFDFIQADAFYPLAYTANGKITEAAFIQTRADKDYTYRRLEYHKWENNTVTVINKAFRTTNNQNTYTGVSSIDLGHEIPLTTVPEWKDIEPETTIKNVNRPLFAYFKMPEANTIDSSSPLGISGFAKAKSLIKDADMQYSRLLWEYEGGELAIDIDRDALRFTEDGTGATHTVRPIMQQRLYRQVDLGSTDDTYEPYAPSLRDNSYIKGLNTILMRIEDVCGISRGTLSEVYTAEARTATELKILKQRSYQTNADIQQAVEDALRDVIYIMNAYCDLYEITPDGEYDISFEWDDSIIVDTDTELLNRITLQQNGLASKLENRMWYFGETERQAKEALMQIDQENKEAMQNDLEQMSGQLDIQDNYEDQNFRRFNHRAVVTPAKVKDNAE